VYNNSADPEGKLSKAETKSLLQTQFSRFIQVREFEHLGLCSTAVCASIHGVIPGEMPLGLAKAFLVD